MDDPSDDALGGPDAGGGFTRFLTILRGVVTAIGALVLAISGLVTAPQATGVIGGDDGPPSKTQTDADSGPNVLL